MRCVATLAMLSLLLAPAAYAQDAEATETAETTAAEQPEAAPADAPAETTEVEAAPAEPAPAPEQPAAAPASSAEPVDASADLERIIVSGVAAGVAVAGLAAGITFGVLALNQYNCLADVVECNKTLEEPILGEDYIDARADVERMALYADMGFLVAATAATVAVVGAVEMLLDSSSSEAVE